MPRGNLSLWAFGFLGVGIASLWIFEGPFVWNGLLVVSVALALCSQILNATGVGIGLLAGAAIYAYDRVSVSKTAQFILVGILSFLTLGLFGHFFPGFQDKVLMSNRVLSPGAYPTSIIWSFDKPLAGLLLMGWGISRLRGMSEWKKILPMTAVLFVACAALILSVAWPLHILGWAPKLTQTTGVFAIGNLLFVCVPEEAFFRGFVQRKLTDAFASHAHGGLLSVSLAAIFFGACHFQGGAGLMLTATVAGLFYGATYLRTGRIEAAILVHALLNLTHFALFTYPALRQP